MVPFKSAALIVVTAVVTWFTASLVTAAQAQQSNGSYIRIVGLGANNSVPLPTDASGNVYLPVRTQTDDRQITFDGEMWQQRGEVESLLLNHQTLPRQVSICGRRLSLIQAAMTPSQTDESTYFPLTVSATGLSVPNEGCYSVTPVAYLRIKGITTMTKAQLPQVVVVARY